LDDSPTLPGLSRLAALTFSTRFQIHRNQIYSFKQKQKQKSKLTL
jgi:hypothetical protein